MIGTKHEELRDKTEYEFLHQATNKHIYLSQLVVGTEAENKAPYLVLMPDGSLYKGWLGKKDII